MTHSPNRRTPDGYMTVQEAADALGVVPITVRRMFQRGQLNKYKDPMNNYNVLAKNSEVEKLLTEPKIAV